MSWPQMYLIARIVLVAAVSLQSMHAIADDQVHRRRTTQQALAIVEQAVADQQIVTDLRVNSVRSRIQFDVTVSDNPDNKPWMILLNVDRQRFEEASSNYEQDGFDCTVKRTVRTSRTTLYSAVWVRATLSKSSLKLPDRDIPITGKPVPELSAFDDLMSRFMKEHNAAGATLAIAKGNRLLYSRGFGYADVDKQTLMQPNTQMRIASVSKSLTAVAVLKLAETGELDLDDTVLPILEKGGYLRRHAPSDDRWKDITIRHLLQHTGGWKRDMTSDPVFQVADITRRLNLRSHAKQRDIIHYMLSQPLDYQPGTQRSYSNFGYLVLGQIIQIVSETDYSDFVRRTILESAGLSSTVQAHTRLNDRQLHEARYYMQKQTSAPAFWSLAGNGSRSPGGLPETVPISVWAVGY